MNPDFRNLLVRYIAHVAFNESVTYLEQDHDDAWGQWYESAQALFSAEEWKLLQDLDLEAAPYVDRVWQRQDG